MASSSSSPACSRDGGTYVAVIRSGLNRHTVTRRRGSRGQRRRMSLRGAGSSGDTDMVFLPLAEAYTVQALMDLSLPRFAGSGVGPQQVHAPWATSTDSPASPATSSPGY